MKHFIIVLSLLTIGFNVQADEEKWKIEIAQYKKELTDRGVVSITGGILGNSTKALAACSSAVVVATASLLADTIPLTGIAAEAIASFADPDYEAINTDDLLSWQTFIDAGRGLEGGFLVAVEYPAWWLLGDEDKHYPRLKKVYESSAAIIKELGADDAACAKSISKIVLLSGELYKRATGSSEDSENQEEQVEIPLH